MSSFSRVISRPTSMQKQSSDITYTAKPKLATTRMGRGTWQLSYPTQVPPSLYKASIGGDFHTDTLFNPVWGQPWLPQYQYPTMQHVWPSSRSPPPLSHEEASTESSSSHSPSSIPELVSSPQTGCSTTAVLGSAGVHRAYAFHNDYDRPEASSYFLHRVLRQDTLLRNQTRMRDGDFRATDDERDYSVAERRKVPLAQVFPDDDARVVFDMRATMTPSRLSRRVRVPPPIDTAVIRATMAAKVMLAESQYVVEIGDVDGTALSSSESGFEADDEQDDIQSAGYGKLYDETAEVNNLVSDIRETEEDLVRLATPPKKSYAEVVATSPPMASTPNSRAVLHQKLQIQRMLHAQEQAVPNTFGWHPFVEPLDS